MDYRTIEEALCRLPIIDAARIVGDGTRISEVHVLAGSSKPPKQVVRDVQSLVMARFGITIDRKTVSVVQLAPDATAGEPDRPVINNIEEIPDRSTMMATVALTWKSQSHVGSASGPAAASARLRIIGEATLRAVEDVIGGDPPLALDAVAVTTVGSRPVIIAQVVGMRGDAEEVSVGCALVRGDEAESAVRAVLDALNRRIPALAG